MLSCHGSVGPPTTPHAQDRPDLPARPHPVRTSSTDTTAGTPTSLPPPPYTASISIPNPTVADITTPSPQSAPDRTPNLCAQFFARYLPAGNHPCYGCYMNPEYAGLRGRWMKLYADGHPGCVLGDVERLSGVERVGERLGLVNVARGVNTAHVTRGRVG